MQIPCIFRFLQQFNFRLSSLPREEFGPNVMCGVSNAKNHVDSPFRGLHQLKLRMPSPVF